MLTFTAPTATEPFAGFMGNGMTPAIQAENWRCRRVKGIPGLWLVGQVGAKLCATMRWIGGSDWDVAFYEEAPQEVIDLLTNGGSIDPMYQIMPEKHGLFWDIRKEILAYRWRRDAQPPAHKHPVTGEQEDFEGYM